MALKNDGIDRVSFIRLTPGGTPLEESKNILRARGYPVDRDDDPIYIDDSAMRKPSRRRPSRTTR